MKHLIPLLIALLTTTGTLLAEAPLLEKLKQIKKVSDVRQLKATPFAEVYEFYYEQPVDHQAPEKGVFKQYVQVGHRDFRSPVVAVLEGYSVRGTEESELSRLFKANQVTIEHRFFKHSVPATGEIPWGELTIAQAAADQHEIIQALRQGLYPDVKWISTGISKGGQTTIFHRFFYPDDVEISVPYVAPLNLARVDPRLARHLARLGKTPARRASQGIVGSIVGSEEREVALRILSFQQYCFERLDRLMPLAEEQAGEEKLTFARVGGVERALKLVILEFPFAFWQWNGDVNEIPETSLDEAGLEDAAGVYEYLAEVSPPHFFSDQSILDIQPFYYAALTEIGMYAYDTREFRKYFKGDPGHGSIDFSFAMPDGVEAPPFDEKQMQRVSRWLQTDAEKMLFIYGGRDPWAGTAVELGSNDKCRKFVKADANHECKVESFEPIIKREIVDTIDAWLKGKAGIAVPEFVP
ncbi:MAG: peptidase [Odoribacteraceae bacterium]|jgi:hypothetical protein|nr:peptidase [Odoribacteraceae bacterium]